MGSDHERPSAFPIWVTAQNASLSGANAAMIFNSQAPPGSDSDLGSPNESCETAGKGVGQGGERPPYRNCRPLGRVLVVARDLGDLDEDGLVDVPNDSEEPGTVTLDFSPLGTEVTVYWADFLDVEQRNSVYFFDASGRLIEEPIEIESTGNNGLVRKVLGPTPGVSKMVVEMSGSGAIDNIVFGRDP